jgi:hypothetical protein
MSGAYKATPIRYLESEMAIPPLDLYFDKWVADFENRVALSGISQLLREAGARAAEMAAGSRRRRRPRQARQTLRESRAQAVSAWIGGNRDTEDTMLCKWNDRWKATIAASGRAVLAARRESDLTNHKTYKELHKHEASVLMQVRTGCVGMADFLFRRRVPDVPTPLCICGIAPETPEHVLLYCRDTRERRSAIRDLIAPKALRTRRDLAYLTLKQPGLVVEWLLRTGKFALYDKARRLQKEWEDEPLESGGQVTTEGIG